MSDPKQTPDANALDDARDRLVERVLSEAVGGETPPDLSASIRRRAEEMKAEVPGALDPSKRDRALRWLAGVGAVAAMLFVAVSLTFPEVDNEPRAVVFLDKKGLVANTSEPTLRRYEGETAVQDPQVGDLASPSVDIDLPFRQGSFNQAESKPVEESLPLGLPVQDEPMVFPDGETWRRITSARAKYKRVDPTPLPAEVPPALQDALSLGGQVNQPTRAPAARPASDPGAAPAPLLVMDARGKLRRESFGMGTDSFSREGDVYGDAVQKRVNGLQDQAAALPAPGQGGISPPVDYFAYEADGELGDFDQNSDGLHRRSLYRFWKRDRDRQSAERYTAPPENPFTTPVGGDALSTFSVDVDTASYTNLRRFLLRDRQAPPPAAVRIEELVNYFDYDYAAPAAGSEDPFAASMEVGACPWKPRHKLVRIGIQGRRVAVDKRPLSNLVFLVDVSGSMSSPDKLPLVVAGLEALTDRLGENDRVAIVVYAGSEGLVLPSTSGLKKDEIRSALGRLQAGGSTAGGAGLKLAYAIAEENKIPGGVNRVVLCTDGDFNVGLTGTEDLAQLVEARGKEQGVFLTVLGFGRGNLNDAMLETISGRGDGHYAYIDSEREARRVLSRDLSGTLVTIAKDVKLQVEFNPAKVASYRLIGYENRILAAKDFNDDTKDAGEIGAGHTVTALYEIVPVGVEKPAPPVDGLKYQSAGHPEASAPGSNDKPAADSEPPTEFSDELLTLKIRYKQPTGGASKKLEFPLADHDGESYRRVASEWRDFRWSAAVAEFGMLMRNSRHAGEASLDHVLEVAREAVGEDPHGQRAEFLDLVRAAKELRGQ